MALNIVKGEDLQIEYLKILIYGDMDTGKTSTALTAKNPILFDFDEGAHRSKQKIGKKIIRIGSWEQILSGNFDQDVKPHDTIVVDTIGTLIDCIKVYLISKDWKLKNNNMRLYGQIKEEFTTFLNRIRAMKKDIIMIAHATTEEKNGTVKTTVDIAGKAKDIVKQVADFVGYMYIENNKRVLNFSPTDYNDGKNSAGLPKYIMPDFAQEPHFFDTITTQMRNSINGNIEKQNKAIEAQLEQQKVVEEFKAKLADANTAQDMSGLITVMSSYEGTIKSQCWTMTKEKAEKLGFTFHKDTLTFTAPAPPPEPVAVAQPAQQEQSPFDFD